MAHPKISVDLVHCFHVRMRPYDHVRPTNIADTALIENDAQSDRRPSCTCPSQRRHPRNVYFYFLIPSILYANLIAILLQKLWENRGRTKELF